MPEPQLISLIRLIQAPEEFHDKRVRVVGPAVLAFERKAVYASAADRDHAVTKNALWLDVDLDDAVRELDGKFVLAEGTFDMSSLGHLKLYSGTIAVDRLVEWSEGQTPTP